MSTEIQEIQETEQTQDVEETVNLQEETVEIQEVEIEETEPEAPSVLRTRRDGVWEVYDGPWGSYLRPIDDPDANVVIDEQNLKVFNLNPNIHKIPADVWSRWVKLCFYYVDKVTSSVEVSIRILRSAEDPSKYRMLVPRQKVSGASVRVDSFDEAIDIETGEEITQYPPAGWIPVGSSHSHNTMPSFFSGIDDKYELGDPGIHLVVGDVNVNAMKYTIAASVVGSGRRFEMPYSNLIDATPVSSVDFHPKVIDYVDYTSPLTTTTTTTTGTYTSWSKKVSKYYNDTSDYNNYQDWLEKVYGVSSNDVSDPYHYSEGNSTYSSRNSSGKSLMLWEVEDLINDYVMENNGDLNKLCIFADTLKDTLKDIESHIALNIDEISF